MCVVDLENQVIELQNVIELAMMKKGISEELARAAMSLFKGSETKEKGGTHL